MATLGRTSIATNDRAFISVAKGLRVQIPEDAQAGSVSLWAYIGDVASGESYQMAIVDDSDDQSILAYSSIRTDVQALGWYQFTGGTLGSFAPTNSTIFHIICGNNAAADANIRQDDAGMDGQASLGSFTPGTPPSLSAAMSSDATRDYSVYMEYTAGAAGPTLLGQILM